MENTITFRIAERPEIKVGIVKEGNQLCSVKDFTTYMHRLYLNENGTPEKATFGGRKSLYGYNATLTGGRWFAQLWNTPPLKQKFIASGRFSFV